MCKECYRSSLRSEGYVAGIYRSEIADDCENLILMIWFSYKSFLFPERQTSSNFSSHYQVLIRADSLLYSNRK